MEQTTPTKKEAFVKTAIRSNAYPAITIQSSLDFVKKVYAEVGTVNYIERTTLEKILGYSSNGANKPLSASGQYGLLEMKSKLGYKPSPLFVKIHKPYDEKEKRSGLLECLQNPKLYQDLIAEYNGNILPSFATLSIQLFRKHSIGEGAADKAAEIFIENLKSLGVLTDENVLSLDVILSKEDQSKKEEQQGEDKGEVITVYHQQDIKLPNEKKVVNAFVERPDFLEIPLPLDGARKGKLVLPEDYTDSDLERVIKIIGAYRR